MALVSPGVETSLIDDSLYVANAASLVPLFFIATQDEKTRSNGEPAAGTYEHSVVRSITSLRQSIIYYGEPTFLDDGAGNQQHGDARNEYGLFAMNQYLTVGSNAFCVRANVNLNDDLDSIQAQWDTKTEDASVVIQNMVQNYITTVNLANGIVSDSSSVLKDVSNKIPASQAQTEQEFNGTLPYGTATVGSEAGAAAGFRFGDVLTFVNGMSIQITSVDAHLGATSTGQPTTFTVTSKGDYTDYVGVALTPTTIVDSDGNDVSSTRTGFVLTPEVANFVDFIQTQVNFSGFIGGDDYDVGDILSMSNNSSVQVMTVNSSTGAVEKFAVLTKGDAVNAGQSITDVSQAGGFSIPVEEANLESLKESVTGEELKTLVTDATNFIFDDNEGVYSFRELDGDFFDAKSDFDDSLVSELPIYGNGFDSSQTDDGGLGDTGKYVGFDGYVALGVESSTDYNEIADAWTPAEAGDLFAAVATYFKFTIPFFTKSSLGANDAARRVSIVAALQSAILSNTDVRSENFQFNVVACPGYPEVVDELLSLSVDQKSEVLVVADTPANLSPEGITNPTNGWAVTTARQTSTDVAYYYPWCYGSNLDGVNVLAAPSGTAIRQMAVSDNISYLWFAPAGTTRGLTSGVSDVGYASGVLGEGTNFVPVALNQGQRDALYQDTASGKINPIVFQPGRGIVIMGQKTSAPTTTALDRINVVRLTMHVRRQLRLTTVGFLFEPNDEETRANVKALADNFLGGILSNRGIVDFLTVCDETNNTADVIDANQLVLDVLIKPTKAVEFISIPIRIVSQGTTI